MHGKDGITREFLKGVTRGLQERKVGRRGGDGGKIRWELSEVNTRTVSGGQNKLIGEFMMTAGDVVIEVSCEVHVHSKRNEKGVV